MKRWLGMLLLFAACVFTLAGCRRGDEKKRPAVRVKAEDFVFAPPTSELADELQKAAKKTAPPPDETDDQKKLREQQEQAADEQERLKQKDLLQRQMANIAKTYASFITNGAASELSFDGFKLGLVRAGLRAESKLVENKTVEVVLVADVNHPDHIVAYNPDATNGQTEVVFIDQKIGMVKSDEFKQRVEQQFMSTLGTYFKNYAAQATERSEAGFKAYLRDNAPPGLSKRVSGGEVLVNVQAQWGNAGQIVAALNKGDSNIGGEDKRLSLMGDGQTRFLDMALVKQTFPNN